MDSYLWNYVHSCCIILSKNQILMVDTKRQHQFNLKITIEYPLVARHGDSHWIDGGLLNVIVLKLENLCVQSSAFWKKKIPAIV